MSEPRLFRILHLEDSPDDAFLVDRILRRGGLNPEIVWVADGEKFLEALGHGGFDLILSDLNIPGLPARAAIKEARARMPHVPILSLSCAADDTTRRALTQLGVSGFLDKDKPDALVAGVRAALQQLPPASPATPVPTNPPAAASLPTASSSLAPEVARLVQAVQQLSLARDLDSIREIVRHAARELTGADGATFVLRDGDKCFYCDEDAIGPLWKGQRFPIEKCISGWAMRHRQPAISEDIYTDSRIPLDAYRPTFVRSLVMVPIRTDAPIGAIGNYWAQPGRPSPQQVELLQALADSTSVAMENVQIYAELEQRVKDRTLELQVTNRELEAFSYSVAHDLRSPLNAVTGYAQAVLEDYGDKLDDMGRHYLRRCQTECTRMRDLIEDLLRLARIARAELTRMPVDLSALAHEVIAKLRADEPARVVEVAIAPQLRASADPGLIRSALENLLSNAWKYTSKTAPPARIEVGSQAQPDGTSAYFVRDNGAGFNMAHATNLFAPFQRLHSAKEFPGTGVGLATVQRILHKHGGRIWAEAEPGRGATFFFTLPGAHP